MQIPIGNSRIQGKLMFQVLVQARKAPRFRHAATRNDCTRRHYQQQLNPKTLPPHNLYQMSASSQTVMDQIKESYFNTREQTQEQLNSWQFRLRIFYRKFRNDRKMKIIAAAVAAAVLVIILTVVVVVVVTKHGSIESASGTNTGASSNTTQPTEKDPSGNAGSKKPSDNSFDRNSVIQLDTLSPTPPPSNGIPAIIHNECIEPGMIALTFDDGPSTNIPSVLAALERVGVKATFFVNANHLADFRSRSFPASTLLRQIYTSGHQIGAHTVTHIDLSTVSTKVRWDEMRLNDEFVKKIVGVRPIHFRAPYLRYSSELLKDLGSWGYAVNGVNLNTRDDTFKSIEVVNGVSQVVDPIMAGASSTTNSFIAMLHDFKVNTEVWVEKFVSESKAKGYRFVTSSECLGIPPYR